jgi:hypothetical protein
LLVPFLLCLCFSLFRLWFFVFGELGVAKGNRLWKTGVYTCVRVTFFLLSVHTNVGKLYIIFIQYKFSWFFFSCMKCMKSIVASMEKCGGYTKVYGSHNDMGICVKISHKFVWKFVWFETWVHCARKLLGQLGRKCPCLDTRFEYWNSISDKKLHFFQLNWELHSK